MNIDGLSEATLEKLIAAGLIHNFADIYHLSEHRDVIENMEGFGRRSCDKLIEAVEKSRETTPARVLGAIGIPGIGMSGARILCSHFRDDLEEIRKADAQTLSEVEGIGPVLADNIRKYFEDAGLSAALDALLGELHLQRESTQDKPQTLAGKTFVITGSVHRFANRNELKDKIRSGMKDSIGEIDKLLEPVVNKI